MKGLSPNAIISDQCKAIKGVVRLCLVGGREKWKEGVVDHLRERDEEGGRNYFFHSVWYDKKERKQKSSLVWYKDAREMKK